MLQGHCTAIPTRFITVMVSITERKCYENSDYLLFGTQGYDTFGPFKLVGGLAKGHPTQDEISASVKFYQELA